MKRIWIDLNITFRGETVQRKTWVIVGDDVTLDEVSTCTVTGKAVALEHERVEHNEQN